MGALCALLLILCGVLARAQQDFTCSTCAQTPSVCCDCCYGGSLQFALCNSPVYASCFGTVTPTWTPTPTMTATNTLTPSYSSRPLPPRPTQNFSLTFSTECQFAYWQVPSGVRNVTLRLWGAGGGYCWGQPGGTGAYVEGIALTTVNETLRIQVGGGLNQSEQCGFGGWNMCDMPGSERTGGGMSSVARLNAYTSAITYIAVAGGGATGLCSARPGGYGFRSGDGCGFFAPQGGNAAGRGCVVGGGGGGWIGGQTGDRFGCGGCGDGGTSCGPQLLNGTAISQPGNFGYQNFAPASSSPYYVPGAAISNTGGLVVISWDGPNYSQSKSSSATVSPPPTSTASATRSGTITRSSGSTASVTSTASVSPYCNPNVFSVYSRYDVAGSQLGQVAMLSTERDCQRACCDTTGCDGYSFGSLYLSMGTGLAPCSLISNASQLIPSTAFNCGVKISSLIS